MQNLITVRGSMVTRPLPVQTKQAAVVLGGHLATWRKLQGLTAEQVAQRAGTTRQTLGKLERGDASVGMAVLLNVARALGQLSVLIDALDPYNSAVGLARVDEILPKRVRQ